jgi:hypothetical protein
MPRIIIIQGGLDSSLYDDRASMATAWRKIYHDNDLIILLNIILNAKRKYGNVATESSSHTPR